MNFASLVVMTALVAHAICLPTRAHAAHHSNSITIADDGGGTIGTYDRRFKQLEASGKTVIIKGTCYSACARFMKLSKVCAAPNARFAFHGIMDDDDKLLPEESLVDSESTDTPEALALEKKYDTFHMGFDPSPPYIAQLMEPGVAIEYTHAHDAQHRRTYQEFLMVDADRLIPACSR